LGRKPKYTKKDDYLLMLGIALTLLSWICLCICYKCRLRLRRSYSVIWLEVLKRLHDSVGIQSLSLTLTLEYGTIMYIKYCVTTCQCFSDPLVLAIILKNLKLSTEYWMPWRLFILKICHFCCTEGRNKSEILYSTWSFLQSFFHGITRSG